MWMGNGNRANSAQDFVFFDLHRLNVRLVQQLRGCNSRKKTMSDINVEELDYMGPAAINDVYEG